MVQPLKDLLLPTDDESADALAALWASLPLEPALCWYPSSGNCFRDLLVWRHYPALRAWPEPDLYLHSDYIGGVDPAEGWRDGRTRVEILENHLLGIATGVEYRVDPDYASLPGLAASRPSAQLLKVRAWTESVGEVIRPVIFFRFENFNWFRAFVLERGLRLSHLFKLREGCGFGGCRASISNLYPWLGTVGVRYLLADPEVHLRQDILRRMARGGSLEPSPFTLRSGQVLGELSGFEMRAWQLSKAAAANDWLAEIYRELTRGSPWFDPDITLDSVLPSPVLRSS